MNPHAFLEAMINSHESLELRNPQDLLHYLEGADVESTGN